MNVTNNLGIRMAAKKALLKRNEKIAQEKILNDITRKYAREALGKLNMINIQKSTGDIAKFSAIKTVQNYSGKLDMTNSVWAPWNNILAGKHVYTK